MVNDFKGRRSAGLHAPLPSLSDSLQKRLEPQNPPVEEPGSRDEDTIEITEPKPDDGDGGK